MTALDDKLAKLTDFEREAVEDFIACYLWGCKQAPSYGASWDEPVPSDEELRQDGLEIALGPKLHLYVAKYKKRLIEDGVLSPDSGPVPGATRGGRST